MIVHGTGHDTKPEVLVLFKEAAHALCSAFYEHVRTENGHTAAW